MAHLIAVFMPRHHRRKLTPEKLGQLRAGLIDGFLGGFVFAPGDGLAARFQAGCFSVTDDAVDITRPHQAAQGRPFSGRIKLVALGGELCRAGFDYFGYLVILGIYLRLLPVFYILPPRQAAPCCYLFPPCRPRIIGGLAVNIPLPVSPFEKGGTKGDFPPRDKGDLKSLSITLLPLLPFFILILLGFLYVLSTFSAHYGTSYLFFGLI